MATWLLDDDDDSDDGSDDDSDDDVDDEMGSSIRQVLKPLKTIGHCHVPTV